MPKGTITGRLTPNQEPNIQNIRPPLTSQQKRLIEQLKTAAWLHLILPGSK